MADDKKLEILEITEAEADTVINRHVKGIQLEVKRILDLAKQLLED